MKKTYFVPETTLTSVEIESLLQNLSQDPNDPNHWSQGGIGENDQNPPAGDDDEGRAKGISVWDE